MESLKVEVLYNYLIGNKDNAVIYDKLPSNIKEGVRDMWDPMVASGKLFKFGFEGWRECHDKGPQRHIAYCLTDMPVHTSNGSKDPKDVFIQGKGVLASIESLEKRVNELEKVTGHLSSAVANIIRSTTYVDLCDLENFDKMLSTIRDHIVIHN